MHLCRLVPDDVPGSLAEQLGRSEARAVEPSAEHTGIPAVGVHRDHDVIERVDERLESTLACSQTFVRLGDLVELPESNGSVDREEREPNESEEAEPECRLEADLHAERLEGTALVD